jgi:dihydroneopterin aldolase
LGEPATSPRYRHERTAQQLTAAAMPDSVFLEGLRFYGYHGVNPEERVLGQRFTIDIAIETDLHEAGRTDDLTKTISYSDAYKVVRAVVEGPPRQLIEAVAEEIAARVMAAFPQAEAVAVTVRKPEAPVKGAIFDTVGVSIRRTRERDGT